MSLFDNFLKDYEKSHYSRYPKSRVARNIIYTILILLLIAAVLRLLTSCTGDGIWRNPRKMDEKTTMRTKDSLYYISFKIDSVKVLDAKRDGRLR